MHQQSIVERSMRICQSTCPRAISIWMISNQFKSTATAVSTIWTCNINNYRHTFEHYLIDDSFATNVVRCSFVRLSYSVTASISFSFESNFFAISFFPIWISPFPILSWFRAQKQFNVVYEFIISRMSENCYCEIINFNICQWWFQYSNQIGSSET